MWGLTEVASQILRPGPVASHDSVSFRGTRHLVVGSDGIVSLARLRAGAPDLTELAMRFDASMQ